MCVMKLTNLLLLTLQQADELRSMIEPEIRDILTEGIENLLKIATAFSFPEYVCSLCIFWLVAYTYCVTTAARLCY